ncbi:MAG: GFA family protein [Polyangiaceae bacterium]|nr:GFA family protein [Polyangiaceae bacterium]
MDTTAGRPNATRKTPSPEPQKHAGSCHCGAVRFEVTLDATRASRCNCTACTKTGVTGSAVKPDAFTLLSSENALGTYEWGRKTVRRFFCKHCGVHCFGRGHLAEMGGDYVSINVSCLDDVELSGLAVTYWDGRHDNWLAGTRETPWPIFASA